jgi:hypothetical protein
MANHGDPNRRTFRSRASAPSSYRLPTLGDLVGRLDRLRVECRKCGRKGEYSVARLVERYGAHMAIAEWRDMVAEGCPKRAPEHLKDYGRTDPCGANCPDLAGVL